MKPDVCIYVIKIVKYFFHNFFFLFLFYIANDISNFCNDLHSSTILVANVLQLLTVNIFSIFIKTFYFVSIIYVTLANKNSISVFSLEPW